MDWQLTSCDRHILCSGFKKKCFKKKSQRAQQMECFKHPRKKTILKVIERICQENVITVEVMKKAD